MFIQNKGQVTLAIELLDTEEAQGDDCLDVQVPSHKVLYFYNRKYFWNMGCLFLGNFKASNVMG